MVSDSLILIYGKFIWKSCVNLSLPKVKISSVRLDHFYDGLLSIRILILPEGRLLTNSLPVRF